MTVWKTIREKTANCFQTNTPTLLNAFELDGPVLVNIMTDPNALAMPPKIEFGQMVGFAQSMYKLLINGRSQEVIDTINSNFKHIREVF